MCGIVGLLERPEEAGGVLAAMLGRVSHRGPDDEGVWVDPVHGLALGHRRLSIIDTSPAGHQPMVSSSGRYCLTYNGEIYNHDALRAALESEGDLPAWRGHSDTEVMLAGFEHWGIEETLRRANGMFALAAWDRQLLELTLARDRIGEKPLYFGWVGGRFSFASELKALAAVPGWTARMDPTAIASFLAAGYVRGPQSAIAGVYRLPAGNTLTLGLGDLRDARDWAWLASRLAPYWSLRDVAIDGVARPFDDIRETLDALEALLRDSVRLRMMADVPLGAFLSGGIDSSLVVALMQAQSGRPVRSFSIGFDDQGLDEAPYARAVARHLGTDHTELYLGADDALALVPRLADTFDEPFADNSQLPTMLVSKLARQHVSVALSGDGGDELFAGYGRYFSILDLSDRLGRVPPLLRRMAPGLLSTVARAMRPAAALPFARALPYRLDRLAERLRAGDVDALRLSFIGVAGVARMHATRPSRDLTHCLPPPEVRDTLRRLMYADQLDYLPDDILHKVDRASMAHGLEARVPLLDHRVIEYSWRLPTSALVDHRTGKQPLRQILDRYVPRELVERPKQGFVPPMGAWLRGPLRDWAESLLAHAVLRELPMLDPEGVRSVWRAHLDNRMDAGTALWSVLMLADWRRRFGAMV